MATASMVEMSMVPVLCNAPGIEADQADVDAACIVYRVKALGALLLVDCSLGGMQTRDMGAIHTHLDIRSRSNIKEYILRRVGAAYNDGVLPRIPSAL